MTIEDEITDLQERLAAAEIRIAELEARTITSKLAEMTQRSRIGAPAAWPLQPAVNRPV